MRKSFIRRCICFMAFYLIACCAAKTQLLQTFPRFIQENTTGTVRIELNPNLGNQGLEGASGPFYVHIGVITNKSTSSSDWKYVNSTWGIADEAYKCVVMNNGDLSYTITGGLRIFFGITDTSEHILKICILFRNTDGTLKAENSDNSDMYLPVYQANDLQVRIDEPYWQPTYTPTYNITNIHPGDSIAVTGYANQIAKLTLSLNKTEIITTTDSIINKTIPVTALGAQTLTLQATTDSSTASQELSFAAIGLTDTLKLPDGAVEGINYDSNDPSKATLVLYAPQKQNIYVIGDFNNWQKGVDGYQMHITPDGNLFWVTLTNLTKAKQYAYQYIIDDSLIVADYNAHLILDKSNDPYISNNTYPDLPAFPKSATGDLASVIETGQATYNWKNTQFSRPEASSLRVYELLVRDFTTGHNWTSLTDSLDYFSKLGINAIELMPFNEFEGNSSWGYNPDFYFAPDKYYGTATSLKTFIDSCHGRGIAVIMDMVLNHSFGQSPMVQMYYDSKNDRPLANNPWFNPVAKHAYNVGYDFNHESQSSKNFTKRVLAYWLSEYNIDGFRFDLAKGFTQKQTCDNNGEGCDVDAWSAYDSSRVVIWDDYYSSQQKDAPGSYSILEFLGNNEEEKHYSSEGMLLWENGNSNFNQLTMGYADGSDVSSFVYTNRGWVANNMMLYMESHDEERLMYKNIQYGNASGTYNIKDTLTALNRNAMAAALWAVIPGPKMIWQFGELGYDYTINYCTDGSGNNDCKTGPKPLGWSYLKDSNRTNLSNTFQQLFKLRSIYPAAFTKGKIDANSVLSQKDNNLKTIILESDSLDLIVAANFGVNNLSTSLSLPDTGLWLPYVVGTGQHLQFVDHNTAFYQTSQDTSLTLHAGAFNVWLHPKKKINVSNWISDLTIKNNEQGNLITWNTIQTNDSTQFVLEKINPSTGNYTPLTILTANSTSKQFQYTDGATGNENALYRLAVISTHGVGYTAQISAGASNIQTSQTILAYPNPSPGTFHIKINHVSTSSNPYSICDPIGRVIRTGILGQTGGDITLSHQAAGIYYMKIELDHKIYKTKLMKK